MALVIHDRFSRAARLRNAPSSPPVASRAPARTLGEEQGASAALTALLVAGSAFKAERGGLTLWPGGPLF